MLTKRALLARMVPPGSSPRSTPQCIRLAAQRRCPCKGGRHGTRHWAAPRHLAGAYSCPAGEAMVLVDGGRKEARRTRSSPQCCTQVSSVVRCREGMLQAPSPYLDHGVLAHTIARQLGSAAWALARCCCRVVPLNVDQQVLPWRGLALKQHTMLRDPVQRLGPRPCGIAAGSFH